MQLSRNKQKTLSAGLFFILAVSLALFVFFISSNQLVLGYNINYQPDQPFPFSHKLHAGEYGIDCRYCHTSVEQGRHAGVPSLDICMNCHLSVKVESPLIQRLRTAYENKQVVLWEKVHLLPDFVKFHHALHIKALTGSKDSLRSLPPAGESLKRACTACHGKVENMEIMYQHESLSMGWCIQCHRKEENQAAINCSTCHY